MVRKPHTHDLDFFTEKAEVDQLAIEAFLEKILSELPIARIKYPLDKLILDAKAKFDWDIDSIASYYPTRSSLG